MSNPYYQSNDNYKYNFSHDYYHDPESTIDSFDKELRKGFITKVYGILSSQLLLTVIFCAISMTNKEFSDYQRTNTFLFILCLILTIIIPIVIICFKSLMSNVPYNYIILFVFTFCESYLVSFICSVSKPELVFMAAFMTLAICISLTIYAFTTTTDFTLQGGSIFLFGCGLMLFSIFGLFTNNNIFHIILSVAGAILFGIYLIYDTQLIIGNKELKLEIDDYILAAFMLYVDIINMFLYLLEILQRLNRE